MPPPPSCPQGTRDTLQGTRARRSSPQWVREQKRLLVTDTTLRDAHQSLLATRMRTYDMLRIAAGLRPPARRASSRWRCGAGRRSTRRCASSRSRPGTASPSCASASRTSSSRCCCAPPTPSATRTTRTTSCTAFVKESAAGGHRRLPHLRRAQLAAEPAARRSTRCCKTDAICEAAICYTGDILDPKRDKYTLKYLRRPGEGAGEARHALPGDQGHGRAAASRTPRKKLVKALRAGDRRADPLPHARLRRRADRVVPAGRRGGRGHRRLRVRPAGRA